METLCKIRLLARVCKFSHQSNFFINHKYPYLLKTGQSPTYTFRLFSDLKDDKTRISHILNKDPSDEKSNHLQIHFNQNINTSSTEVNQKRYENDVSENNGSVGIDVDEELQRYDFEEFIEVEEKEEEVIKIPKIKPMLKRGVHGVFDAEEVHQLLQKERLKDVTTIAIPPEKNFCDHMVIATASNKRQLSAVAEKIRIMYKQKRELDDAAAVKLEGASSQWIAFDLRNVVVHLMMPEIREKYKLENLWTGLDPDENEEEEDGQVVESGEFSFDEELKKVRQLRDKVEKDDLMKKGGLE